MFISYKDARNKIYVGYSSNLKNRLVSHKTGSTYTTKRMDQSKLVYYESYSTEQLARGRELKLKMYGSSYTGLLKRLGLK